MTKHFPPPPTKFGAAGLQTKAGPPLRHAVPPPPTAYGPNTAQRQSAPARITHAPPPTRFAPPAVQAKSVSVPPKPAPAFVAPPRPTHLSPIPQANPATRTATVQPFLIAGIALGVAAAAYGAYRYYRHRRRENAIDRIRVEHNALAPFITTHTENHAGPGVTSTATTANNMLAVPLRTYDVYINRDDPVGSGGTSPALVESARVHERTHISADQWYTANTVPGSSQLLYHLGGMPPIYHSYPLYDRADRLLNAIAGDGTLTDQQRAHMDDRVRNNSVRPSEWDSTINELLVYSQRSGIRANSSTVKLLVEYANENLQHRHGQITDLPRLQTIGGNQFHQRDDVWDNF